MTIEPGLDNIRWLSWMKRQRIKQILSSGEIPVIQFSCPTYTLRLLGQINALCSELEDRLQVRFYGHYGDVFDAAVLRHLPDAQNIALDSLHSIVNEGTISEVRCLKRFSFGVLNFDDASFLSRVPRHDLIQISVHDNAHGSLDLQPLGEATNLRDVYIRGQRKNIDVLAALPDSLWLQVAPAPRAGSGWPKRIGLRASPSRYARSQLGGRFPGLGRRRALSQASGTSASAA